MSEMDPPRRGKGSAPGYDYKVSVPDTLGDPVWMMPQAPVRQQADTYDETVDDGLLAIEARLKDGADELGYVSHGDVEWLIELVRATYQQVRKS